MSYLFIHSKLSRSIEVLQKNIKPVLHSINQILLTVNTVNVIVDLIIDLATLTGACVVALGEQYAGLFSDDTDVVDDLLDASEYAGERLWPMPLAPEYNKQLKSKVADIKNIGGRSAGAITAALFLNNFVDKTPWAHLDIAGPAFISSAKEYHSAGGVGFGVRTLAHYLLSH